MSVIDNVLLFFFQWKRTPLHESAREGRQDVVKLLLQQPNVVIDSRSEVRVHYGNISIVS